MAADKDIRFRIRADTQQAEQGFGKLENKFTTLKGSLGKMAGAMGLAFGGYQVLNFLKSSLTAFGEQEEAINKLNQALEQSGQYTKAYSDRLIEMASAFQRTTIYADETITTVQKLLIQFGATPKNIERTTKVVLDLASALRMDLQSAALLLGKALQGETGTLGRYGIVIDQTIPRAQKFEAVLLALEKRFGGSAQAEIKGYAGQIKQLENKFGDLKERIGEKLVSTVIRITGAFNNWIDVFDKLITSVDKLAKKIDTDLIVALRGFALDPTIIGKLLGGEVGGDPTGFKAFQKRFRDQIDLTKKARQENIDFGKSMMPDLGNIYKHLGLELEKYNFLVANSVKGQEHKKNIIELLIDKEKDLVINLDLVTKAIEGGTLKGYKLNEVYKIQTDILNQLYPLTKDYIGELQKLSEMESPIAKFLEKGVQGVEPIEYKLPGLTESELRNEFQTLSIIADETAMTMRNGFMSAWEDIFGEANSLFEQFLQNIASGLADLAAKKLASFLFGSLLNILFPVVGTGVGVLAGGWGETSGVTVGGGGRGGGRYNDQTININVDGETLMRAVVTPRLPGEVARLQRMRIM